MILFALSDGFLILLEESESNSQQHLVYKHVEGTLFVQFDLLPKVRRVEKELMRSNRIIDLFI